jgi:hypothetical protein
MGASLCHLTVANLNLTQKVGFGTNRAVDLAYQNPNNILYFRYNLNQILKLAKFAKYSWQASDLIVQITWIPELHFPVGYVLSPPSLIESRVIVNCDQCDLADCKINSLEIVFPDGKKEVHRIEDFFNDEDEDVQDRVDENIDPDYESPKEIDPKIIPERLLLERINHAYSKFSKFNN